MRVFWIMNTQAAFTRQCFFMNMMALVFVFTEEVQRFHIIVLAVEVNYVRRMWEWHFWQALEARLLSSA